MTELELMAHRLNSYSEIENLMALHTYYHASVQNREELLNCWSQTRPDEVVWSQNFGRWVSMDHLMPLYGNDNWYPTGLSLKAQIAEAHPEIAEEIYNLDGRALTEMPVHVLASPIIEIAEDGMHARGVWYTPGFALRHDFIKGGASVMWMWEKYGADFIYENGQWRFLHLLICMDMVCGADNGDWSKPAPPMGPPPEEKKEAPKEEPEDGKKKAKSPAMGGGVNVPPDEPSRYKNYSATRIPTEMPPLPRPYKNEADSISY